MGRVLQKYIVEVYFSWLPTEKAYLHLWISQLSGSTYYVLKMIVNRIVVSYRVVNHLISSGAASKTTWEGSLQNTYKIFTLMKATSIDKFVLAVGSDDTLLCIEKSDQEAFNKILKNNSANPHTFGFVMK